MDWSRAKNILILLLLILNVFLLISISLANPGGGVPKETIEQAKINLQSKGITLECDIPRNSVDNQALNTDGVKLDRVKVAGALLGEASFQYDELKDNEEVARGTKKVTFISGNDLIYKDSSPNENVKATDIKEAEKYSRKFISGLNLFDIDYYLDSVTKNSDGSSNLIFTGKYKKFLIFDNYINITLTNKGVTSLEYKGRSIKNIARSEENFMPAYLILLENFTGGKSMVITGIDIGFGKEAFKELSESLVWRVKIKGSKEPRYFLASNGEEIKLNN